MDDLDAHLVTNAEKAMKNILIRNSFERGTLIMNENIYTIAVLTAKEGRLDDLRSVLEALAKET